MTRVPTPSGWEIYHVLLKAGFEEIRVKGSHHHLRHPQSGKRTVIAHHSGEFPRALFKKILKQTGLSEADFRRLL